MDSKNKKIKIYDIVYIGLALLTLFTGLSVFSYSPSDPSYSNIVFTRYDESVNNIFGKLGAYFADMLGTLVGWAALFIPLLLMYVLIQSVRMYRGRINRGRIIKGAVAGLIFILSVSILSGICGQKDVFFVDKISGGLFGVAGATIVTSILGKIGGIIVFSVLIILSLLSIFSVSVAKIVNLAIPKKNKPSSSKKASVIRKLDIPDKTQVKEVPALKEVPPRNDAEAYREIINEELESEILDYAKYTKGGTDIAKVDVEEKAEGKYEKPKELVSELEKFINQHKKRETQEYMSTINADSKKDDSVLIVPAFNMQKNVKDVAVKKEEMQENKAASYDGVYENKASSEDTKHKTERNAEFNINSVFTGKLPEVLKNDEVVSETKPAKEESYNEKAVHEKSLESGIKQVISEDADRILNEYLIGKDPVSVAELEAMLGMGDSQDKVENAQIEELPDLEPVVDSIPLAEQLKNAANETFTNTDAIKEAESIKSRENMEEHVTVKEMLPPPEVGKGVANVVAGKDYHLSFSLLDEPDGDIVAQDPDYLRSQADLLLNKLRDFGVDGRVREIRPGPVVTMFEFEPAPGIKINKIANLENDLALAMSALSVRIIAPIPGKAAVGIEVPNAVRQMVSLRELLETKEFKEFDSPLAVAFGKDASGRPYYNDLRKMPHILVAGTTGSGKSVCINTFICSVLFKSSPDAVKFVMIDPKMVELSVYDGIPHLAAPVVTDPRKASAVLNNVVKEMEGRYSLLASCRVKSIDSYNNFRKDHPEQDLPYMPYMVVIVDEFGDLMMVAGKEVENAIIRIAQMARAVGIHLVLATQRPSVNVITGIIKANMPARLSFRVSSKIDSRTILDQNGAELLLGRGDSLFVPPGSSDTIRIHGCFVSEEDVLRVVDELKNFGEPEYNMALLEEESSDGRGDMDEELDSKYEEALNIVMEKGFASISMIQRYLRIGYNRAARIVETMEHHGVIAPSDGTSKPREVIKR